MSEWLSPQTIIHSERYMREKEFENLVKESRELLTECDRLHYEFERKMNGWKSFFYLFSLGCNKNLRQRKKILKQHHEVLEKMNKLIGDIYGPV